jgi:hypothetical protein
MKTTEGLGDVVVRHALDPDDAAAIMPMNTAAREQKGAPWRIEARRFFDALMEGVSPRCDVTFESATVGPKGSEQSLRSCSTMPARPAPYWRGSWPTKHSARSHRPYATI